MPVGQVTIYYHYNNKTYYKEKVTMHYIYSNYYWYTQICNITMHARIKCKRLVATTVKLEPHCWKTVPRFWQHTNVPSTNRRFKCVGNDGMCIGVCLKNLN